MSLTSLSNEIIWIIAESLDSQKDISSFVLTNVRFSRLLNNFLYQYNVKYHNASALLWAARHDQETTMRNSLHAGADMPMQSTGKKRIQSEPGCMGMVHMVILESRARPITAAAANGSMSCLRFLLELGVDPDLKDGNSHQPLPRAAENGHVEAVKLLVAHGADALSAMWPAAIRGHLPVLKVLFAHLESKNISNVVIQEALRKVLRAGACSGCLSAVEYALSKGADVNHLPLEARQSTPPEIYSEEEADIIQSIISEGPSTLWSPRYHHALDDAVYGGNEEVVRLILDHGADTDLFGGDALVRAICEPRFGETKQLRLIELLLEHGVDVNVHQKYWNPLEYAVAGGNKRIIELLKSRGAVPRGLFWITLSNGEAWVLVREAFKGMKE